MRRIVIVGGGFSGTLLSVHLLRHAAYGQPIGIHLIESEPRRLARGFAYSTPYGSCLLNVPAARMSAFEDDLDHFVRWAHRRDPSITGATFVPRSLYGEYLASLLCEQTDRSRPYGVLETAAAEAVAFEDPSDGGEGNVLLGDQRRIQADRIVLATGNLAPRDPPADVAFLRSPQYTRNPWDIGALSEIPRSPAILLIGTGLTMFDVALALRDVGHTATLIALSRRGLLPQAHRVSLRPPPLLPFPASMQMSDPTPAKLLRALRAEIRRQCSAGADWREVITSLRHDTPRLWQSLDLRGRQQFLRHLRPFWETHRHRAAPETARRINQMRERRELIVLAAAIRRIEQDDNSVRVTVQHRTTGRSEVLSVGHVINCTGPDTDLSCGSPLLANAIRRGLVVPDALGLGLELAADGAVIRSDGTTSDRVFALGPLRRAQLWETTAVPELRVQAAQLAQRLLSAPR